MPIALGGDLTIQFKLCRADVDHGDVSSRGGVERALTSSPRSEAQQSFASQMLQPARLVQLFDGVSKIVVCCRASKTLRRDEPFDPRLADSVPWQT